MSGGAPSQAETLRRLHELVEALDRRVPHVERAGEIGIAKAAATLKSEALGRIAELEAGLLHPGATHES